MRQKSALSGEAVELSLEGSLGRIPSLDVAEILLRGASGKLETTPKT